MKANRGITPDLNSGMPIGDTTLESLVSNLTFSDLNREDFVVTQKPVFKSGSTLLAPQRGECWLNPSLNTASNPFFIFLSYNGTDFVPIANGLYVKNVGASILSKGQAAVFSAATSGYNNPSGSTVFPVVRASSVADKYVLGVAAQDISTNNFGFLVTHGIAYVALEGSLTTYGALLSAASGNCTAASKTITAGTFGRLISNSGNLTNFGLITGLLRFA